MRGHRELQVTQGPAGRPENVGLDAAMMGTGLGTQEQHGVLLEPCGRWQGPADLPDAAARSGAARRPGWILGRSEDQVTGSADDRG